MIIKIEKLIKEVSPPENPIEIGNKSEWEIIENKLNLKLPDDYKEIIDNYGTGKWLDFLYILNPFAKNKNLNLFYQTKEQLDAEREIRDEFPEEIPFPLYPEEGGLLPWGMTDNGNRLYWLTKGKPDKWVTIIYESRGPDFDKKKLICSEILLNWITRKIKIKTFPRDFDYAMEKKFYSLKVE